MTNGEKNEADPAGALLDGLASVVTLGAAGLTVAAFFLYSLRSRAAPALRRAPFVG